MTQIIPVNFSTVGAFPGAGAANSLQIFVVDDNSIALFQERNGAGEIYVLDVTAPTVPSGNMFSGNWTYYSTPRWRVNGLPMSVSATVPLGGGNFLVTLQDEYGNTISFMARVQNLKLNNGAPIVVPFASNLLSNPCYPTLTKTFYDGSQNILLGGYYDPSGQNGGPVFASAYSITRNGYFSLIGQGFVGTYNSVTGFDPLDKTIKGGGFYSQNLCSNGMQVGYVYATGICQSFATHINAGFITNCSMSNGALVTTSSAQAFQTGLVPNGPEVIDAAIPGLYGVFQSGSNVVPTSYNGLLYFFDIAAPSFGYPSQIAVTKKYFCGVRWGNPGAQGYVYATLQSPLLLGASNLYRSGLNMVNHARPISLTGNYKS